MYAEAPSMMVSLWQLNDFATSEIMKLFYEYLTKKIPKDVALRAAKLQYVNSAKGRAAHPAFWSPFISIGDTKPIVLVQKRISSLWLLGAVFLLVAGSIIYVFWHKK